VSNKRPFFWERAKQKGEELEWIKKKWKKQTKPDLISSVGVPHENASVVVARKNGVFANWCRIAGRVARVPRRFQTKSRLFNATQPNKKKKMRKRNKKERNRRACEPFPSPTRQLHSIHRQ
jgi:hypothetical protein